MRFMFLLVLAAMLAIGGQLASASDYPTKISLGGMAHIQDRRFHNTGRCIDFSEATANGQSAKAQLWACTNYRNLEMGYRGPDTSPHVHEVREVRNRHYYARQIVHIHNGVEYCLDIAEGSAHPGAGVRWWKCNGTPAQDWSFPPYDFTPIRSVANPALCLDPEHGFNDDRNGQRLQLWHCHGGNEQLFYTGNPTKEFTNGLYDMQRECRAQGSSREPCTFTCAYRKDWKHFWYDGVEFSCGYPDGRNGALICTSPLDQYTYQHDWYIEPEPLCWCECSSWGGGEEKVGAHRNRTRKFALKGTLGRATIQATKSATAVASAAPTLNVRGRQAKILLGGILHIQDSRFHNTGRCIDFSEATANGQSAKAQLWACSNRYDGKNSPHNHLVHEGEEKYFMDPRQIVHVHKGVNYCLDVAEGKAFAGINNDWNGQRLQLWYCHGGMEQRFMTGSKDNTNGLYDMRNECHTGSTSRADWKICRYDGVDYSCEYPDGPNRPLVCASALDPRKFWHDWSPEPEPLCWCECSSWGGGEEKFGASRNRTRKFALKGSAGRATVQATKSATVAAAAPTLAVRGRQ
ncbi:hypothetical protein H9P43_008854 [Blastocladiella emersonii ATCC 22665]|nr:hypothetical protein H9P43_008854 [Blastocladiella emersonii ATCC 22665]